MTNTAEKQHYDRIACVFQGGGALGAFQVGAFKAIKEYLDQNNLAFNFFAGVSIGAINAAIIAGNPPEKQLPRLLEFWNTISPRRWNDHMIPFMQYDTVHHAYGRAGSMNSILYGLPGFFKPRAYPYNLLHNTPDQLSYYDTAPLRDTLLRLIDFKRINSKEVTLYLGAVNIESGQMKFFNNQETEITPEHIMASGALPPGFPAVKIDGEYYWDGGIFANSPLTRVLEATPKQDTLCFMVDCFRLKGDLPTTMDQVEEREKDIHFGSRSRWLSRLHVDRENLEQAIAFLGEKLPPEVRENPAIQKLLELGCPTRISVAHIIFQGNPFTHAYKDYNFSRYTLQNRLNLGYRDALNTLKNPVWEQPIDEAVENKRQVLFYST